MKAGRPCGSGSSSRMAGQPWSLALHRMHPVQVDRGDVQHRAQAVPAHHHAGRCPARPAGPGRCPGRPVPGRRRTPAPRCSAPPADEQAYAAGDQAPITTRLRERSTTRGRPAPPSEQRDQRRDRRRRRPAGSPDTAANVRHGDDRNSTASSARAPRPARARSTCPPCCRAGGPAGGFQVAGTPGRNRSEGAGDDQLGRAVGQHVQLADPAGRLEVALDQGQPLQQRRRARAPRPAARPPSSTACGPTWPGGPGAARRRPGRAGLASPSGATRVSSYGVGQVDAVHRAVPPPRPDLLGRRTAGTARTAAAARTARRPAPPGPSRRPAPRRTPGP